MRSLRHLLPSIGDLVVFEAAGRLKSFTGAGLELNLSQAAVSYSIRRLEDDLGTKLFRREHRRVELTDAGTRFLADVTLGLSHIRSSAEEIRNRNQSGHVTLAASTSFASFWMLPRLQKFREDLPSIDLRIQTADRDLSLAVEGIPLGVRGGAPDDWPDYESRKIADEVVLPVASPKYLAENPDIQSSAEAIAKCRLIHLEEPSRPAVTWGEWLRSAGVDNPKTSGGLRINDYVLVIQAAMEGQGIALGWQHLIGPALESGLLASIDLHPMRTGKGFYVIWPKTIPLSPAAASVRDWLVAHGAAS